MKQTLSFLLIIITIVAVFSGCASKPDADFGTPEAVIDAILEQNPIQEGEIYGIYDDLKGKTVCIKTNMKRENDISFLYEGTYKSNTVTVVITGLYDDNAHPLTDFDYNKGDYVVTELEYVTFRGTKSGNIREYTIFTVLPE